MAKNTPKVPEEDFDLDDFKAMTNEIDEKRPKQPRPKTSEHVIKISDDGQERPKSVRPPEMNKLNGHANGTTLLGFLIWNKIYFFFNYKARNFFFTCECTFYTTVCQKTSTMENPNI